MFVLRNETDTFCRELECDLVGLVNDLRDCDWYALVCVGTCAGLGVLLRMGLWEIGIEAEE